MSLLEYISEVSTCEEVSLGSVEEYFLNEICVGQKSAYKLFSILRSRDRPMAYKNVHKRVNRLKELSLIEEVQNEKFRRGAKNYRLTTPGLFYLISNFVRIPGSDLSQLLNTYHDNVIVRTLIDPYFEWETIRHANIRVYFAIIHYLWECCHTTLNLCNNIRSARNEQTKDKYFKQLEAELQWHIRALAFKVVTKNDDLYRSLYLAEEDRAKTYDYKRRSIILRLSNDERFMSLLSVVKSEFEEGSDKLEAIANKKMRNS